MIKRSIISQVTFLVYWYKNSFVVRATAGICMLAAITVLSTGCNHAKKTITNPLFETLDYTRTGLDFSNNLTYNQQFNLFKYMYFYNGSGIGAGDFNNDGLIDLFFGSSQHANRLYINMGGLTFKDITKPAGIPDDGGWSTGISVIDINNDGLLDIYVCRVGDYDILHSKNQLLINQGINKEGIPVFADKAHEFGLDFSGFSTQAVFFDYDMDGDPDMFLLNHSVHENGTFRPRKDFLGTYHLLSGDRIYRNDGKKYTDVTKETGINSSAISYGLGITVADINLDGYPDVYIGNDFHENDYLYINQHNGTFKEEGEQQMMHTSQFTMGVDVGDINNDAFPEIISMDMLPSDPYILKRSLGEDEYDIFNYKISAGYSYQYTRNNLQYNRRNGVFSETGLYSGVAATDWSWAPLWVDFDNDGYKDLFVANGIPKRMNDIDYINFISNGEVQQKINENNMKGKDMALIDKFPEIKLPNKFYRNTGDLSFADETDSVRGNIPTFSNGAVYADLDNDGDLDIVVNNMDAPVLVYENKASKDGKKNSIRVKLAGSSVNRNAIGAKIIVYAGTEIRTYEKFPVRGFMSSMEIPLLIGIKNTSIDSFIVVWPDNTFQKIEADSLKPDLTIAYQPNLPLFNYSSLINHAKNMAAQAEDITGAVKVDYVHKENHFSEFDREPLIPHMISAEGPALAVADIDHDGLEDVFIGAARDGKNAVLLQQRNGTFTRKAEPALSNDSSYEDVDAVWTDVNNDGHIDLVVASGGNEFYGDDAHNSPRIYLNDGKGNLVRKTNAFQNLYLTASAVAPFDFNGDGFVDLFIAGRAVPWEYGRLPQSYLLQNNGSGKFTDVTAVYAPLLSQAGFVTSAQWVDIDTDGDKDLLLSLEWGGITVFLNDKGKFSKKSLTEKNGWWNFLLPCDIDNDGDIDLIAGNLGLNSRLKASGRHPVRLYYNDFDDNGKKEQVMTYYIGEKELPFASKAELEKQMPFLKKKFLYAEDFAKASLEGLFGAKKLETAARLSADYFSNAVLVNNGDLQFEVRALPFEAQLSSFKDGVIIDANNDQLPDILLFGNYYNNNIEMGRYDADYGTVLLNKGKGSFTAQTLNGLSVRGQVRHVRPLTIGNSKAFILARNNDSAVVIKFRH